ncbi:hypothetical protein ACFQO1_07885 [Jejudonia soesokkakensis]|uniref:DUF4129 domain-containing protein n=1 Tax=Jejudonia soesokkakensis TaxID=1323432 RepID=A0ABW2MSE3_9FLAO
MNKIYSFIVGFFGVVTAAIASVQDSLQVKIEDAPVPLKKYDEQLSEKYSGDTYDYDKLEGEAENLITQFLNWFFRKIGELFGIDISPEMIIFLRFFFYVIIGIIIVYIIVRLLVGERASSFFTRKSTLVAPLNIQEEHIETIDLDVYITDALSEKNYRLAIRYMYLKSLKMLSLKNIIDWHFDKTNTDYYHEITNTDIKEGFKKVSYLYDNIWYGEYVLDENGFYKAQQDFDILTKKSNHAG